MGYVIALIVMAIMAASRGQRAWTTTVSDGFDVPREKGTVDMAAAHAPVYDPSATPSTYPQTTAQQAPMRVTRAEV